MKNIILIIFLTLFSIHAETRENFKFYINKALENNLELNAERKKFESAKQNERISKSEFLPSLTITGDKISTSTSNKKNQSGSILPDSNLDTESKSISLEQVIFSGFKGINTFKKSELETQKANLKLKDMEQKTILEAASAYCDLIYKFKNEQFNISNVNLFERQVEFDNARLQKGEITLTDLAQSESSLAGANANLIKAKTELLSSITNFERVTREKIPEINELNQKIILDLPDTLNSALNLSNLNNIELLISKLDYEIAKRELSIEKSRFSPSASIKISKSENKDFSSTIDTKDDETVQATISWPLIKGGENVSSIKKSSFNKQRAQLLLKDKKNKINTDTSNSWSKYKSSKSVLEATSAQLEAAEIANEGITLEYDSGSTRSTLEVVQSRSLLLDAQIAFIKSQRDFVVSQFELAKQVGTLSVKSIK